MKKRSIISLLSLSTIVMYAADQVNNQGNQESVQQMVKIYASCSHLFRGIRNIEAQVIAGSSVEERVDALIKVAHKEYMPFEKHAETDLYCTVHAEGFFQIELTAADGSKRTAKQQHKIIYDMLENVNQEVFDCIAECQPGHKSYIAVHSKNKS